MNFWTDALKCSLLCGVAVSALGTTVAARAQAPATTTADAADVAPATADTGNEIIVTAQRRAERVENIPMIVAAVSGEQIVSRGLTNLHDLGQAVPGVQVNLGGGFTQTAIRGVGTLTTGVGVENNVALYIDGYYQPDTSSLGADFANIESVEVLKGPQGTLWGRNATGGAILVHTLAPSDVLTGRFEAKIGNFNEKSLSGYISGPLSDSIRVSLAAYNRSTDGYYKSLNNLGQEIGNAAPVKATSVRGKIEIDVTENLNTVIGANYTRYSDNRGLLFVVEQFPLKALLPSPPARADQPRTWTGNRPTLQVSTSKEATWTTKWTPSFGTLTSYTGYTSRDIDSKFDFDASFNDISFSDTQYQQSSFQQGVDFGFKPLGSIDVTVGGTYWNDSIKANPSRNFANFVQIQQTLSQVKTVAWAGFIDADWHIADRLTLNAGGRYTTEKRTYNNRQTLASGALAGPPVVDASVDFQNFSPRASLRFEVADRANIYASYTQGFRSGGSQVLYIGGNSLVIPIRPETITAYEIGFKTTQPWGQFEVAAFHYDYRDIQVGTTITNPTCGITCAPINAIANAEKAKVDGVESSATFRPADNLEISLGGAYLKARYVDFPGATGNGFNATTQLNVAGQAQNWSGQQMARAPSFSALFNIRYAIQNVFGGELTPSVNVKYTDSYVLNNASLWGPLAGAALATKQRYRQDAYTLVNAALTWEAKAGYMVSAYVNNLTDTDYHLNRSGSAFGDYGTWAAPRTYGLRVGYRF